MSAWYAASAAPAVDETLYCNYSLVVTILDALTAAELCKQQLFLAVLHSPGFHAKDSSWVAQLHGVLAYACHRLVVNACTLQLT